MMDDLSAMARGEEPAEVGLVVKKKRPGSLASSLLCL
jgi:hypothetical protein